LALTVTLAIGLGGVIGFQSEPLPESTTSRPPLALESVLMLPAADMASASTVTSPVAENAGATGPDTIAAPPRTSAPTKREVRFIVTPGLGDDP